MKRKHIALLSTTVMLSLFLAGCGMIGVNKGGATSAPPKTTAASGFAAIQNQIIQLEAEIGSLASSSKTNANELIKVQDTLKACQQQLTNIGQQLTSVNLTLTNMQNRLNALGVPTNPTTVPPTQK